MPDGPMSQPSRWLLPMPTLTETPMPGASQQGRNHPSNQGGNTATSNRGGKSSTSTRGGKWASAARGRNQTASGAQIDEYHMACVTRGAPVTSPILPGIIEDKLPPHIRVRDHFAKTLRVAVWLHRLDMALSNEPVTSGFLVQGQHYVGHLLPYFLAPGTTWDLRSKDVINQVLKQNRAHNERRCSKVASSLKKDGGEGAYYSYCPLNHGAFHLQV